MHQKNIFFCTKTCVIHIYLNIFYTLYFMYIYVMYVQVIYIRSTSINFVFIIHTHSYSLEVYGMRVYTFSLRLLWPLSYNSITSSLSKPSSACRFSLSMTSVVSCDFSSSSSKGSSCISVNGFR